MRMLTSHEIELIAGGWGSSQDIFGFYKENGSSDRGNAIVVTAPISLGHAFPDFGQGNNYYPGDPADLAAGAGAGAGAATQDPNEIVVTSKLTHSELKVLRHVAGQTTEAIKWAITIGAGLLAPELAAADALIARVITDPRVAGLVAGVAGKSLTDAYENAIEEAVFESIAKQYIENGHSFVSHPSKWPTPEEMRNHD